MRFALRPVQFADPLRGVDTREAYKAMASLLASHMRRLPGGRTLERERWRGRILAEHAQLVLDHRSETDSVQPEHERYGVRGDATEIEFGPLGYAEEAVLSYRLFRALRDSGQIPDSVRFQVSMPAPITVATNHIRKEDHSVVLPALARALMREFDRIIASIPPDDLSFQWTVAVAFFTLETGGWSAYLRDEFETVVRDLAGLGNAVPGPLELGFHFSYGDLDRTYLAQQANASRMFTFANALLGKIDRPVDWMQIAIPADKNEPGYFVPLAALRRFADTQIFLGLIHPGDDIDQAGRRMMAGLTQLPDAGIAAADTLNIQSLEQMREALAFHRSVAEYVP